MSWKRILVGVDASPQAAAAAALAVRLAKALRGECIPVHAVRQMWLAFAEEEIVDRSAELQAALIDASRREVAGALREHVPEETLRRLIVRPGSPAAVLRDVARDVEADAVVLGGKHHLALRRWAGGSTAHNSVRTIGLPVLVLGPRADAGTPFRRGGWDERPGRGGGWGRDEPRGWDGRSAVELFSELDFGGARYAADGDVRALEN